MRRLASYRPGDKVVIADDIRNVNFEDWKDFFGGQQKTSLRDPHGWVQELAGPFFFVFLCNYLPEFTESQWRYLGYSLNAYGKPELSSDRWTCRIEEINENLF
jgi:hypothetical protein